MVEKNKEPAVSKALATRIRAAIENKKNSPQKCFGFIGYIDLLGYRNYLKSNNDLEDAMITFKTIVADAPNKNIILIDDLLDCSANKSWVFRCGQNGTCYGGAFGRIESQILSY